MRNIFRYERKFIINNFTIPSLENLLRNSKFKFKKNYAERKVNSIYFDNGNFDSFFENIDGNNFKNKFRLRWYGDKNVISSPTLEIKKKVSYNNSKVFYKIKNFKKIKLSKKNIEQILNKLRKKYNFLLNKSPISSTHYNRLYFISSKNNVRATIDYNINYNNYLNYSKQNNYSKSIILEIKYSNKKDDIIRRNLENISFRINKNSKYINSLVEYPYLIT